MAHIGPGRMDIEYLEGENLDNVMKFTECPNLPSEELMVVLDSEGNEISFEKAISILNKYGQDLLEFNKIGPEEKKFNEWLNKEKENGLVDFRVSRVIKDISCKADGTLNIDYEEIKDREKFFKELNYINEAVASGKAIPITDL